jgi:regulator of sigma E protease
LAVIVYAVMFSGQQTFGSTRLGIVTAGEPAWRAGLRPGDTITAVDGSAVSTFDQLRELISSHPGQTLHVTYTHNNETAQADITPDAHSEPNVFQEAETRGRVGVSPQYVKPLIAVVDTQSPAAKAGVMTGDLVKSVAGKPIETWYELREAVAQTPANEPLLLGIERENKEVRVSILAQPAPAALAPFTASSADTAWGYTGLVSQDVVVAKVDTSTPAARLGLKAGDRLLELQIKQPGGQSSARPIAVWNVDLAAFQGTDARSEFLLTYQRDRDVTTMPLTLDVHAEKDELKNERTEYVFGAYNGEDLLGMYTLQRRVAPHQALFEAVRQVGSDATLIAMGIGKMIRGHIPFNTLGGPIMLFVIAEKSAKHGIGAFFRVMAVISVNLGVLNILPIPVLDGGHLLFFVIEAVRRRPPSLRTRELANMVGLVLLALLMVLVLKNDLLRYVLG